jgi:hypothetical protein
LLIKNSVASVRKRTIPTERTPIVSEVSANFLELKNLLISGEGFYPMETSVHSDGRKKINTNI